MSVVQEIPEIPATGSKRKRDEDLTELEVDLNAAEPPSKKALRKAKRGKATVAENDEISSNKPASNKVEELQKTDAKPSRSPFGIWIGNLSFATTKEELMKFITSDKDHPISEESVTRINLPAGPTRAGKPQNKGFAYIDFSDEATLNSALELSEKLLVGRRVLIKNAKSFEGRPATKEQVDSGKPPSRKIFVGNLAFDTTVETLEEHFGVCGTIQKCQVATFEDSGKCKGYAWVEFESLPAAQAAMRGWVEQGSDGGVQQSKRRIWLKKMNGKQLRMEYAEDSTTRYNKRYGKDAKKKTDEEGNNVNESAPIVEVGDEASAPVRQKQKPKPNRSRHGYSEDTVQRLTGGIMESQGKKVTFD